MDDILPQYRSPRDTPLSLGLRFFYPTLSNGITLYQLSSAGQEALLRRDQPSVLRPIPSFGWWK